MKVYKEAFRKQKSFLCIAQQLQVKDARLARPHCVFFTPSIERVRYVASFLPRIVISYA